MSAFRLSVSSRAALERRTPALPPFKEHDAGSDRDIEGGDGTGHGDVEEEVAMFLDVLVEAAAFCAKYEHGAPGEVDFVIRGVAALIKAINPEAGLLEFFQGAADVGNARDRQMFEGARSGAGYGFGERRGAAFPNDDGIRAHGMGGAHDGAKVVRIFNAIKDYQQARVIPGGNGVEVHIFVRGAETNDALVSDSLGGAIERFARLETHRHLQSAAQIDDFLNARAGAALGNQDLVERALGAEGLTDRMNAGQQGAGRGPRNRRMGSRSLAGWRFDGALGSGGPHGQARFDGPQAAAPTIESPGTGERLRSLGANAARATLRLPALIG